MTVLDRVPLDDITAQARQVRLGHVLLTLLAGFFYVIGWTVGRLFLGVVWCGVAVRTGWKAGRASGPAGSG